MFKAVFLVAFVSAGLVRSDSQRGDWYERYQGDTLTYDAPAEAQVNVGLGQSSGHWQDAYRPVKTPQTSSSDTSLLQKVRDELAGVGNSFFGSLRKLSGGSPTPVAVAEERMSSPDADPLIDFDADFNIGHPSLGYIGNGFHLRSAATKAKSSAGKSKRQFDLQGESTQQVYGPQGGAEVPYPTGYSYQTSFAGSPASPRPQRDSPPAQYQESFYEYREPSHQGFIPVNQQEIGGGSSSGLISGSPYRTPYPEALPVAHDASASYYAQEEPVYQPAFPQPQPQPQYEGQYEETVTKPPLHVKIQQDLGNLVNGIVAPIKNLMPKVKTPPSETPIDPSTSYQLVASPGAYQPVENYLEAAYNDENEVAHRYEAEPVAPSGLFSTPYGKPPLLEKIKQDFFYWLPKSKREVKYTSGSVPQAQPQIHPESAVYPQFPVESLPAKNHQVRQVSVPSRPAPSPSQPPAFISSTGSGDGAVLFKIIPVETNGAAPLYQIVPSGPTSTSTFDSTFQSQPTVVTSHSTKLPITTTHGHDRPIQLTSAPSAQYQYHQPQPQSQPQHVVSQQQQQQQQQQQLYEQPYPPPQAHFSQRYPASELRSSDVDPLRTEVENVDVEDDDNLFAKIVDALPEETETSRSGKAAGVHDFSREMDPSHIVQIENEESDSVPNVIHSYQVDMLTKNSMDPLFVSSKPLDDETSSSYWKPMTMESKTILSVAHEHAHPLTTSKPFASFSSTGESKIVHLDASVDTSKSVKVKTNLENHHGGQSSGQTSRNDSNEISLKKPETGGNENTPSGSIHIITTPASLQTVPEFTKSSGIGDSIFTANPVEEEGASFESLKTDFEEEDDNSGVVITSIQVTESRSGIKDSKPDWVVDTFSVTTAMPHKLEGDSKKLKDVYVFPQKSVFVKPTVRPSSVTKLDKPIELTSDTVVGLFQPSVTSPVGKSGDAADTETSSEESVQQSTEEVIEFRPYRQKPKRHFKGKGGLKSDEVDQRALEPARRL